MTEVPTSPEIGVIAFFSSPSAPTVFMMRSCGVCLDTHNPAAPNKDKGPTGGDWRKQWRFCLFLLPPPPLPPCCGILLGPRIQHKTKRQCNLQLQDHACIIARSAI